MSKTISKNISRYYPKSDGIISSKPNSCYCGSGDNFTKIMLYEKNSTRYMCKECKKSYIVKSTETTKLQLKKMGCSWCYKSIEEGLKIYQGKNPSWVRPKAREW